MLDPSHFILISSLIGRDGGYATKSAVPAEMLVPVPDNVSFAYAAAATDAGMTSYHAVVGIGGAKKGMKVGILGVGGLGQIGARIAVLQGCEVYAASRNPDAQKKALELGCKAAVSSPKNWHLLSLMSLSILPVRVIQQQNR